MSGIIHISFVNTQFECPYCQKKYEDSDDFFYDRIVKNKKGYTTTKCECGERFGIASDMKGDYVSFKLEGK